LERARGEQREAVELEPVEGRYYGDRRVSAGFIPAEFLPTDRRYRAWLQSNLNLAQEEQTPGYIEYWRAIMLRKWSILALAMLVAAITAAAVSRMPPVYRASATLLIEADRAKLVPIGDTYNGVGSYYREYFQTQTEVLKSR